MKKKLHYLSDAQATLVRQWWHAMQPVAANEKESKGFKPFAMLNRGDRARLRRSENPTEVLCHNAFQRLAHHLMREEKEKNFSHFKENDITAYAMLAGALAHVTDDLSKEDLSSFESFAALLGQTRESGRAAMSELRFQHLQSCTDEEDFYRQVIRAVDLLRGKADVVALADDLLAWVWECRDRHDVEPRKRLKTRWAADYYQAVITTEDAAETT